jgi:hypothetical protein
MNSDQELIAQFVRVREYDPDVIVIFVGRIVWASSHEADIDWVPLIALPIDTPPAKVQKQAVSVLLRKRYFAVCQECSERKPQGWMHTGTQCQSCAEKHGAVY